MTCLQRRLRGIVAWAFAALLLHALPASAGVRVYTDRTAFLAAVGTPVTAEDFEAHAAGPVSDGATLGDFRYGFDASVVQPTVAPGGWGGRALGGPFDVFVGGDAVSLTYTGATALRALGADVLYAPSFDTVGANLYRLLLADGAAAGAFAGNPVLDAAGGAFFLGLIADAGSEFHQVGLLSVVPVDANGDPLLLPAYQFDNLAYAALATTPVPEPATLVLVLLAWAIGAARRLGARASPRSSTLDT